MVHEFHGSAIDGSWSEQSKMLTIEGETGTIECADINVATATFMRLNAAEYRRRVRI